MSRTWLILDCPGLCYQSFYAMPNLSHNGVDTAVVFGFLKTLEALQEQHQTSHVVFAFDEGISLRTQALPEYKANRRQKEKDDPNHAKIIQSVRSQIVSLRDDYLPGLGFGNVLSAPGYEADDVIASVSGNLPVENDEAIVVGSDGDFLQLLSGNVRIWNPRSGKMITLQSFTKEWGIRPKQWAHVKALAGCSSDNIKGIAGIGEVKAVKFIRGDITKGKDFDKIMHGWDLLARNYPLVRLPYDGTPVFCLRKDDVTREKWVELAKRLGMTSLIKQETRRNFGLGE